LAQTFLNKVEEEFFHYLQLGKLSASDENPTPGDWRMPKLAVRRLEPLPSSKSLDRDDFSLLACHVKRQTVEMT
jgi:hypothetical protein